MIKRMLSILLSCAIACAATAQAGPPLPPASASPVNAPSAADDPFGALAPMSDEQLLEARGGFTVDGDFIDIAGFLIEFSVLASQGTIAVGGDTFDIADLASGGDPAEYTFEAGLGIVEFNNTRDNVQFSRFTALQVNLPNYHDAAFSHSLSSLGRLTSQTIVYSGFD